MIRRLAITAAAALAAFSALAAPTGSGPPATPTGPMPFTPPAIINVVDFGAKCDTNVNSPSSGTDDTAAINTAIAAWKTAGVNGPATLTFPRKGGLSCKTTSPLNFTGTVGSPRGMVVDGLNIFASFTSIGPIGTATIGAAGTGGTPGTYTNVPLTGGTGTGCTAASIVVSGGGVTSVTLAHPGCGSAYAVGDTLSATSGNIGSTSGFSLTVATTSGRAAVDAMGMRWVDWKDAYVYGDCTSAATAPNVGFAIGRVTTDSADNMIFDAPHIDGCWALAPIYNNATEQLLVLRPILFDNITTHTTYVLVQDGANHFNWSSSFVSVTAAVDTLESFLDNTFIDGIMQNNINTFGNGIWAEGTSDHNFMKGNYIATSIYPWVLYEPLGGAIINHRLHASAHLETINVQSCFFLTGPYTTQILDGLTYEDTYSECQTNIFKTDANVVSVAAPDMNLHVDFFQNSGILAFSAPSIWTVSGHYYVRAGYGSVWNLAAANFQGTGDIGGVVTTYGAFNGINLGAWTSFTPTLSCSGSGSPPTTSILLGSYIQVGKTVTVSINMTLSGNGTCSSAIKAALPATSQTAAVLAGRENASTGSMLQGFISASASTVVIQQYNNSPIQSSGNNIIVSGTYQSQ